MPNALLRRFTSRSSVATSSSSDPPPPYSPTTSSSATSAALTPPVVFPDKFVVDPRFDPVLLVDPPSVVSHLRLLSAFDALHRTVESSSSPMWVPKGVELDSDRRWALFVQLAVGRFETTVNKLRVWPKGLEAPLLPLDVALVLHTYLLNPRCALSSSLVSLFEPLSLFSLSRRFDEDKVRILPQLGLFDDILLNRVVS
jgi:hypothetical protein